MRVLLHPRDQFLPSISSRSQDDKSHWKTRAIGCVRMQCLRIRSGALLRWPPQRGIGSLPMRKSYDLLVIGSGPASQKCALDAAKKGKTVAIVDAKPMIGGVCTVRGWGCNGFAVVALRAAIFGNRWDSDLRCRWLRPVCVCAMCVCVCSEHWHDSFEDLPRGGAAFDGLPPPGLLRAQLHAQEEHPDERHPAPSGPRRARGAGRRERDDQELPDRPAGRHGLVYARAPPDEGHFAVQPCCAIALVLIRVRVRIHTQISSNDPSVGSYGVRAEKVLIAVGTSPARRSDIPFDGVRVLDR